MDKRSLETRIVTLLAAALPVCCSLVVAMMTPARADNAADLSVLNKLEQKLLFTTYGSDDIEKRLTRIEKRIFGDPMSGTVESRLSRLSETLTQENPDGTTPKPQTSQSDWVAGQQTAPAAAAPIAKAAAAAPSTADQKEAARERVKMAVRAAKEEEINSCLGEGVQFWRAKRGPEALDRFEQVIRLDPGNAEAMFSMGIIQEAQGNFQAALSSYQQASRFKPDSKDYRDAIAAVQKKASSQQVVDSKQAEIRGLSDAAASAYRRGEYQSALEMYKELDQRTPNQALVKYNIGTVYLMMKVPQKALQFYREAHAINPSEQRFIDACNKLEPVIQASGSTVPGDQSKKKKKDRSNNGTQAQDSSNGDQNVLVSYGISARAQGRGVTITTVSLASKAARAGLQVGDIIRAIDGTVVNNAGDVSQILSRKGPSDAAQLVIQRDQKLAQVIL